MDDIYENIKEYDPHKNRKILIVFDDMIADMFSNKKLNPIVTELLLLLLLLLFFNEFYFIFKYFYIFKHF